MLIDLPASRLDLSALNQVTKVCISSPVACAGVRTRLRQGVHFHTSTIESTRAQIPCRVLSDSVMSIHDASGVGVLCVFITVSAWGGACL